MDPYDTILTLNRRLAEAIEVRHGFLMARMDYKLAKARQLATRTAKVKDYYGPCNPSLPGRPQLGSTVERKK